MPPAGWRRWRRSRPTSPGPTTRYVPARLPELPFADGAFDLVLSGHLLFTYPDHMDEAAHLAALRELVRVSRHQVRVFPLVDTTVTPSPYLDDLRRVLESEGATTALRRVPYHFQRGADTMLVIDVPGPAAGAARARRDDHAVSTQISVKLQLGRGSWVRREGCTHSPDDPRRPPP